MNIVPGRIVRYVDYDGAESPAIIVIANAEARIISLWVFAPAALEWRANVPYSERCDPDNGYDACTWHWPSPPK